jgi:hypothetical protein
MVECLGSAAVDVAAGVVATFCVPPPGAGEPVPDGYVWELTVSFNGEERRETLTTPFNTMGFVGEAGEELGVCARTMHVGEPAGTPVFGECVDLGRFWFLPNYDTDGDGCVGSLDFRDYRRVFGQCVGEDGGYYPKAR